MKPLKKLIEEYNNGAVYTAFDTETTGLSRHTERVIEIGAVKFSKEKVIAEYNVLIYPEKNMSPQVIRIHGISDEMLVGKPIFREIAPAFLDFITGTTLVAHNAQFDIGFINKELELAGMSGLKNARATIDTLYLSRRSFPEAGKHSLQFLADFLSIPSGTAHRATDDARVCMELFRKCIIRAELKPGQ
ncbi:MAG: 3'-5' exonuclease [Treponemataceae bacterium]|nr:3'-5' exonuclease [Treponemataceae bacterium]